MTQYTALGAVPVDRTSWYIMKAQKPQLKKTIVRKPRVLILITHGRVMHQEPKLCRPLNYIALWSAHNLRCGACREQLLVA